MQYLEPESR